MNKIDLVNARWIKSSFSSGGDNCVEIAFIDSFVAVRDSKNPDGPGLLFQRDVYGGFLSGVTGGQFAQA